jgi:L-aspartate oxidase
MKRIDTGRVVIVGAGLAAQYAALHLAPRPVLMISPEPLGQGASSAWAQGGVAAAMDPADSAAAHARDTVQAGAGTVDAQVAQSVTDEARTHIVDLTELGTLFDRTPKGGYVMSREAAHSFARVVRVRGDQAGAEIMRALTAQVRAAAHIQVLEGVMATGLELANGAVCGLEVIHCTNGQSAPCLIRGAAVLLAGGGSGGLFALTTNPPRVRGQVIGMAARVGAVIADAEFVQFHPTAILTGRDPAPLATEALRGEGAILVNDLGERFMTDIHPDAELAPRDIVARANYRQIKAGRAVFLDTRAALGEKILTAYPTVAQYCQMAGIDPVADPIPVTPAAHYHMGGVKVDEDGRSSLPGLWVCGEASCTGLHGANRLASNSLLEAIVYGARIAEDISGLEPLRSVLPPFDGIAWDAEKGAEAEVVLRNLKAVKDLRAIMSNDVGVERDAEGLRRALRGLLELEDTALEVTRAYLNMITSATLVAAAALKRTESRGGHFRTDFPQTSDAWQVHTEMTLGEARAIRAGA